MERAPPPDVFGVNNRPRRGSAREEYIPATLRSILGSFAPCFTAPSFENFLALFSGWILCSGRHCLSRVIQVAGGAARTKHFSSLYRFFSRGRWTPDALGRVLFELLLPHLPQKIEAAVDDTLCPRSGPHVFAGGMHHDASRSTYGGRLGRSTNFSFGHCWVVLTVRLPLSWDPTRGLALPILFRLYRSKKRCPASLYRKRTELAAEMVSLLESWIPPSRRLYLTGDAEYACKALVPGLAPSTVFIGPMHMEAALHAPRPAYSGRGRPKKRGKRMPTPRKLTTGGARRWKRCKATIYGCEVVLLVKTMRCLWPTVAGDRLVSVVVTRDPSGHIADRAYFSTEAEMSCEETLEHFSRRWMIEVAFRNLKQLLGLGDPKNGWWRRRHGSRRPAKRAGPQPRGRRGEAAILHTTPFVGIVYSVIVLWYVEHGHAADHVRRTRRWSPWYTSKRAPSFEDMLAALRAEMWAATFLGDRANARSRQKLEERLWPLLRAA